MKINIHQTISNILTEDRSIIRSKTSESIVLYPDEGKKLKNKKTGALIAGYTVVSNKASIEDYMEVDE